MYAWNACKMTEKTDHWTWFKFAIVINICLRLCYNTFHLNIIRLIYSSRNKVLTKKKITTNKHSHIALWFDVCVCVHEWRVRPYVCECYFSHIINKIKNIIILNSEHYMYTYIFLACLVSAIWLLFSLLLLSCSLHTLWLRFTHTKHTLIRSVTRIMRSLRVHRNWFRESK